MRLGEVMHAVGGIAPALSSGVAQFDISSDGTLAVLAGGPIPTLITQLAWVDQGGAAKPCRSNQGAMGRRVFPLTDHASS